MPDETTPPSDRRAERAEALITQAGVFARWATKAGTEFARRLPGAAAVESELHQIERTVLGELRRRLDNVDPLHDRRPPADGEPAEKPVRSSAAAPPKQTEPLRVAMAELLLRSMEQTKQRAREYLYLTILRQLLPDEARILSALADGSTYPVIHVDCRTGVAGSRRVLANASTVGRAAGVAVPAFVPRYLTRLRRLDLVEIGEQDPALSVQYDICLTDDVVRHAEDAARAAGRARIVRQTVRISALGRELWDACHPREEQSWDGVELPDRPAAATDPGHRAPAPTPVVTPTPQTPTPQTPTPQTPTPQTPTPPTPTPPTPTPPTPTPQTPTPPTPTPQTPTPQTPTPQTPTSETPTPPTPTPRTQETPTPTPPTGAGANADEFAVTAATVAAAVAAAHDRQPEDVPERSDSPTASNGTRPDVEPGP